MRHDDFFERHVRRQRGARHARRNFIFRVDHHAHQIFRRVKRNHIERIIAANQHKAAHHRRGDVIRMKAAQRRLRLHAGENQVRVVFGQRRAEKQIDRPSRADRAGAAAAEAAAERHVFAQPDLHAGLIVYDAALPQNIQHVLRRDSGGVLLRADGQFPDILLADIMNVLNQHAGRRPFPHFNHVAGAAYRKAQHVETRPDVGDRRWRKDSYPFVHAHSPACPIMKSEYDIPIYSDNKNRAFFIKNLKGLSDFTHSNRSNKIRKILLDKKSPCLLCRRIPSKPEW